MSRHHLGALALLAAVSLPLVACAQQSGPAPGASAPAPPAQQQRHHRRNPYMSALRTLNLTDAQKQQIAGFMRSARTANQSADPQTRRANMLALRKQIDGVLNDDQRSQLQASLARERRDRGTPAAGATQGAPQ